MKVTRTRTHRFNLAPYESLETGAVVEVDTEDLGLSFDSSVAVADTMLDDLLRLDIDRADELSRTPEQNTYLHAWKDTI